MWKICFSHQGPCRGARSLILMAGIFSTPELRTVQQRPHEPPDEGSRKKEKEKKKRSLERSLERSLGIFAWNVGHFIANEKWKSDAFLAPSQNNTEEQFFIWCRFNRQRFTRHALRRGPAARTRRHVMRTVVSEILTSYTFFQMLHNVASYGNISGHVEFTSHPKHAIVCAESSAACLHLFTLCTCKGLRNNSVTSFFFLPDKQKNLSHSHTL